MRGELDFPLLLDGFLVSLRFISYSIEALGMGLLASFCIFRFCVPQRTALGLSGIGMVGVPSDL